MKDDQKRMLEEFTLKSLEAKLRSLPEPKIPETLEAKLHATIPQKPIEIIRDHPIRRRLQAYGLWTTAAAAVLVLAWVLASDYAPPASSQRFVMDLNDRASRQVPSDQNAVFIEDTNLVNSHPE